MSHRTFTDANSIEARQHVLDNRCERTHPKRHRTSRRSAKKKALLKSRAAHKQAMIAHRHRRHLTAMRAFWAGETDSRPA